MGGLDGWDAGVSAMRAGKMYLRVVGRLVAIVSTEVAALALRWAPWTVPVAIVLAAAAMESVAVASAKRPPRCRRDSPRMLPATPPCDAKHLC